MSDTATDTRRRIGRSQWTDVSEIPDVIEREDVMAILDVATSGFYKLREKAAAKGRVFVPEIEPRIGRPRYRGDWIRMWLRGELDAQGKKIVVTRHLFGKAAGGSR